MVDNSEAMIERPISLAQRIIFNLFSKIQYGKITVYDSGRYSVFSGTEALTTHAVTVRVNNPKIYRTVLLGGSIGAGKSYMDGDWEVDDLTKLIEIFIQNTSLFKQIESPTAKIINFLYRFAAKFRPNNPTWAKKNILSHYDLSNEFFQIFLDPTMMYSCAIYEPGNITQEEASRQKLATICNQLRIKSSDHILEIGTGWGGFALFAAREYGCKVTTTTISDKQYQYVKNLIQQSGLSDRIELLNLDYRKLTGQYDKLVSIEMIEAVGHRYFDTFFKQCNHLVKSGGLFFLQAITINDQSYQSARKEIDFIKKYIFPGGCLPSIHSISQSITSQTQMQLIHLRDIGKHYVTTLNDWQHKFVAQMTAIKQQGFSEKFIRMWVFYFSYCAAGFDSGYISTIHALWQKRS